jgi:hypothetical protein
MNHPLPSLLSSKNLTSLGLELEFLGEPLGMRLRMCNLGLAEVGVEGIQVLHNRMFQGLIVPTLERTDKAWLGLVRHGDGED